MQQAGSSRLTALPPTGASRASGWPSRRSSWHQRPLRLAAGGGSVRPRSLSSDRPTEPGLAPQHFPNHERGELSGTAPIGRDALPLFGLRHTRGRAPRAPRAAFVLRRNSAAIRQETRLARIGGRRACLACGCARPRGRSPGCPSGRNGGGLACAHLGRRETTRLRPLHKSEIGSARRPSFHESISRACLL